MGVAFVIAGIVYAIFDPYGTSAARDRRGAVRRRRGVLVHRGRLLLDSPLRKIQADVELGERERDAAGPEATDDPDAGGLYLPETSIWPLAIGVGTAMTLLGIPLKWWFFLPGVGAARLRLHRVRAPEPNPRLREPTRCSQVSQIIGR